MMLTHFENVHSRVSEGVFLIEKIRKEGFNTLKGIRRVGNYKTGIMGELQNGNDLLI